jgi:hypothetical protein
MLVPTDEGVRQRRLAPLLQGSSAGRAETLGYGGNSFSRRPVSASGAGENGQGADAIASIPAAIGHCRA